VLSPHERFYAAYRDLLTGIIIPVGKSLLWCPGAASGLSERRKDVNRARPRLKGPGPAPPCGGGDYSDEKVGVRDKAATGATGRLRYPAR